MRIVIVTVLRTQAQDPALGPANALSVATAPSVMVIVEGPGVPMVNTQPGVIGASAGESSRPAATCLG